MSKVTSKRPEDIELSDIGLEDDGESRIRFVQLLSTPAGVRYRVSAWDFPADRAVTRVLDYVQP